MATAREVLTGDETCADASDTLAEAAPGMRALGSGSGSR